MRKFLLTAALLAGGCSSSTKPAAPPAEKQFTAADFAAAKPSAIRFAMDGQMNAMPSLDASGNYVAVVWTGTRNGVMNVYAAVSQDGGITFPFQGRVNDQDGDASANVEQPPRVAIAGSTITVIWPSRKTATSAIRMARSTDGGRTFSHAVTIHNASLKGARGWTSIAAGSDGLVRAVWLDGRNAQAMTDAAAHKQHMADMAKKGEAMDHSQMSHGPRQDVYAAVIDPKGKISETQVATNVCFCCRTAVAIAPSGRVYAAWRNIFPGSIRDIAMATSTDGGRTFGPLARVSEDKWEIAGCPEDGPAIAIDAHDAVHLAWPTVVAGDTPQKAIFYSLTKDGVSFTPRFRLSATSQEEAAHPQIASGKTGVAVVWDEPHGQLRQIVLRAAPAGSGNFAPAKNLNTEITGSYPVIAAAADDFLVVWTSGEGNGAAIELRRVTEGRK